MCNPSQGFYGSNNIFSPATQAVWDAAYNTPEDCPYEHDLAAALEALADQVVPDGPDPEATLGPGFVAEVKKQLKIRSAILAIAAELKAHD